MLDEFQLNVTHKPSYYIEMISLLHCLATKRCTEQALGKDHDRLITIVGNLLWRGLEFYEFFLYEQVEDEDTLMAMLDRYPREAFLERFFTSTFKPEEVTGLVNGTSSIEAIAKANGVVEDSTVDSMYYIIHETSAFIAGIKGLFHDLSARVMQVLEDSTIYHEKMKDVNKKLRRKMPSEVTQEIITRRFKSDYDHRNYHFVPSYFLCNFPIRVFNETTQILAYPLKEFNYFNDEHLVDVMKVIGDKVRLQIIKMLASKPMFGKELAESLGISRSTVSHHLDQLRTVRLLIVERKKNTKYFSLNHYEYKKLLIALGDFVK